MVDRVEYRFALLKLADILLSNKNDTMEIKFQLMKSTWFIYRLRCAIRFCRSCGKKIARLVLNTLLDKMLKTLTNFLVNFIRFIFMFYLLNADSRVE